MCTTRFWGIAGALACAYFAYLAYAHVRDADYSWSHDWESVFTGGVWVLLLIGLLSETRCWRERAFFGLLMLNFTLAFVLSVWKAAPDGTMRTAREISLVLWLLAALASLLTLRTPREGNTTAVRDVEKSN
jgi:hypothetical protein